jgi:hypothetical protein
MQLSLAHMRAQGYECDISEHYNYFSKKRKDLFHIADIVAIGHGQIIFVQTTGYSGLSAHLKKIRANELLPVILNSKVRILVHGWKRKKRTVGVKKIEKLYEREITIEQGK